MSSKPGDDPDPNRPGHLGEADRILLLALRTGEADWPAVVGRGLIRRRLRRFRIEALGAARAFVGPSDS